MTVRDGHVSFWPKYDLPETETLRPVAVYKHEHDAVVTIDGEVIPYISASQFIKELTERRLIVFTYRLLDKKYFPHLQELMADKRVKVYVTRTQQVTGIYIKSRTSAWLVERRIWDDSYSLPDREFLNTIQTVYSVNRRSAATPGALGERKIREILPRGTRFNRPNTPLRSVLLANKIGGRADTVEEKKHYGTLYEQDICGAYPAVSMETIDPGEHPVRFGSGHSNISDDFLSKFFSYYCHAIVVIPLSSHNRFGPLPQRSEKGLLTYPTRPGTAFDGWWWKHELDRAREAGYDITITQGYGWYHSSTWLKQWALNMWQLRQETSGAVRDIIKREMVAALGRFGISPETLTLVPESDYQDGDIPITVSDARNGESPFSGYYMHITPNPDQNSLTQIFSYIVSLARCVLYDRIMQEEQAGNSVVASNYDSLYTTEPTKVAVGLGSDIGQWKQKTISNAYIYGPRSIKGVRDGTPIDIRPGVPLDPKLGRRVSRPP